MDQTSPDFPRFEKNSPRPNPQPHTNLLPPAPAQTQNSIHNILANLDSISENPTKCVQVYNFGNSGDIAMSAYRRRPPFRSLDIYRLVVARRLKQLDVAASFGVDPTRISQIVRRVRNWVNATIGDWLFPGREDFRFYVALEFLKIRVFELPHEPENVMITGPGGTYSRQHKNASEIRGWQPPAEAQGPLHPPEFTNPQLALSMSAHPLNSTSQPNLDAFAATPDLADDYISPDILRLGTRMAQLLILWDKHHKSRDPMKALS